jgi:hypothetical protein
MQIKREIRKREKDPLYYICYLFFQKEKGDKKKKKQSHVYKLTRGKEKNETSPLMAET